MGEIRIYKAPASYLGVTTSPAEFEVLDALDIEEGATVSFSGLKFVCEKISPQDNQYLFTRDVKFFLELPAGYAEDLTDSIKCEVFVYPPIARGDRFAYVEAGQIAYVEASACINAKIVSAPYSVVQTTASLVEFFEFNSEIGAPVGFPNWYAYLTPIKAPAGGHFYDVLATLFPVRPHPLSNPVLVMRLQQAKERRLVFFTHYIQPVSPEFKVSLAGRAAYKLYRMLFSSEIRPPDKTYVLVDGYHRFGWVVCPPSISKSQKLPFVFRKAVRIREPSYLTLGSPELVSGVTQLTWSWVECSFKAYTPFELGDIIVVRYYETENQFYEWLYKVVSVSATERGNDIVYDVRATHPIFMQASMLRIPFRPYLMTPQVLLDVIKSLAHYPRPISLYGSYENVYIADEEQKTFNTLHEALEYLLHYLNPRATFVLNPDGSIDIVPATELENQPFPSDAEILMRQTTKNETTNTVKASPAGVSAHYHLARQRGVYISTTYPIDYKRSYKVKGFYLFHLGSPVEVSSGLVEWVENVTWYADPAGYIETTLETVKYG